MALVSIIVAVYNCESFIEESINSLLQQTYEDIEILICDDNSYDDTWNLLNGYSDPRIRLFRNVKNEGVVYTRNRLLYESRGDFLAIQDGDDWSEKTRISLLMNEFKMDGELGACGTAHFRVVGNKIQPPFNFINSFNVSLNDCIDPPFMPATLIFRRKVFETLGGYNFFFKGLFAEDLYWLIRVVEKYKVRYFNIPLYYYRFNPHSITNTIILPEQFFILDLLHEIINQRKLSGTDCVECGDNDFINKFRHERLSNSKWVSEQFRKAAAVQRDGNKRKSAFSLIIRALLKNPFSLVNYRTLRYVIS